MFDRQRLKTDVLALSLLAATVFLGLSLGTYDPADPPATVVYPPRPGTINACGQVGALVAHTLNATFGMGAWFILFSLAVVDVRLFARKTYPDPFVRGFGWLLLLASACIGLRLAFPGWGGVTIIGSGGFVGAYGLSLLEAHFSLGGTTLLLLTCLSVGLLLTTDTLVMKLLGYSLVGPYVLFHRLSFGKSGGYRVVEPAEPLRVRETEPVIPVAAPAAAVDADELEEVDDIDEPLTIPLADGPLTDDEAEMEELPEPDGAPRGPIRVNPPVSAASRRDELLAQREAEARRNPPVFKLPTTDLLEHAEPFPFELLAEKARVAAGTLEKTFKEFGLNVRVVEIDTGPVITQFELELEAGLRLAKVTALADDLAIALRVPSVRVVAPIPGKNTVGVEVPNDKQVMVRLRELIEACPDAMEKKRIPVYLGKDVSGRPLVVDLAKMPHLLIAGRTGTGKSVCLNTLILSMLMSRTPDQVKMLMIDPKMVELSPYKRVPHLMHPVITDMKKAEAVLAWAVDKMEERYDLLARCGVRHLDSYNELGRDTILKKLGLEPDSEEAAQLPDKMPYIVIIADEMADMMMTSG
ncbi:MAG TPA: DNA translocase FtsK 4TM domain-containing protein [Planctomycetaceae bacterium]|nr:DNA translocase FtsK 4TM domain-containing protein [Planctomycetaceae bacterium]